MSNNDQYEYPDGSSSNKTYGVLSKEGRTESLIPPFMKEPKTLAMVLGASVLFYLITHLLSYAVSNRKPEHDNKADLIAEKSKSDMAEISVKIAADNQKTAMKLSSFSNKVESAITDAQDNSKRINDHNSKINALNNQISGISQEISNLKNAITELSGHIDKIKLDAQAKKVKPKPKKVVPVKLKNYAIRAMIRGRAWVQSSDGNYLTVKIGDRLPTYGVITYIDEVQGLLKTSSGRDIRYDDEG